MNELTNAESRAEMTFAKLIAGRNFRIPAYQRPYAWTEINIRQFCDDIAEHTDKSTDKCTNYYLGHYIFENNGDGAETYYEIIDGQQRLITVALFVTVCRYLLQPAMLPDTYPLLSLQVADYDNPRFQELLEVGGISEIIKGGSEKTSSGERMAHAINTFLSAFGEGQKITKIILDKQRIAGYLETINDSYVSEGVFAGKAVAAQIFELQNTRGVRLTETEKVKAMLIKYVYLNSNNNNDVAEIQNQFGLVYQHEETAKQASFRGEMELDDILAHHLRAIDDGCKKSEFDKPQHVEGQNGCLEYVRERLKNEDGVQYAIKLAQSFAMSLETLAREVRDIDKRYHLVGDVVLLDQRRSMIFLLRLFALLRNHKQSWDKNCEDLLSYWEKLVLFWDWHEGPKGLWYKDSFGAVYEALSGNEGVQNTLTLVCEYYWGKKKFGYQAVWNPNLYEIVKKHLEDSKGDNYLLRKGYYSSHVRLRYLFYKYEIADGVENTREVLRGMFKKDAVSLDHIVAHEIGWVNCVGREMPNEEDEKWWKEFQQDSIDGIGNLVLLDAASNSSLGACSPMARISIYEKRELKSESYVEFVKQLTVENHTKWKEVIENRGKQILEFLKTAFAMVAT
jgi:hypothetical protein